LRQRASDGIDRAAGIERHHDLDGAVGEFGAGREGERQQRDRERRSKQRRHGGTIGHFGMQ
jgi:hypothetical protein